MAAKTDKQLMSEQGLSVSQFKALLKERNIPEASSYSEQDQAKLFGSARMPEAANSQAPQSPPSGQQAKPGHQAENASSVVHAAIGPSLVYTQQFATGYDECLGNLEEQLTDFMVQRAGAVLPNSISRFHERLPEAGIAGGEAISNSPFQFPSFNPPVVQRASLPSVPGNVSAAKQLPAG